MSATLAKAAEGLDQDEQLFTRFDAKVGARLAGFLRPYRLRFAAALAAVLAYTAVQVAIPVSVRYAVDGVTGHGGPGLQAALVAFGVLVAANAVLNFLQEWLAARLAQQVIFDLRRAMFERLQRVSLSILDRTQVGRLMSRLQGDVNALQEFFEQSVSAVGDLALLVGITVVLLAMDLRLGLLTVAVLPVLALLRAVWIPWARATFRRARDASSAVNAALAENINGVRTVQESRREALNLRRYDVKAKEHLQAQLGSARASQLMVPLVDALTGVALAIVVLVGGGAVLDGSLGAGVVVAYIFYVQRFFDPIRTLSMQYTVMQRAMAAGHRIFELLDLPLGEAERPGARALTALPEGRPAVELRGVHFGYRPGQPVLHGIDLRIERRQCVALVGATGSGKSSIAALVRRFYDVWDGEVRIGGVDVRDLTAQSLGRAIAMVPQEPFLFTASILDNIRYARPDATPQAVRAAAEAVGAHAFIEALPQGYDTPLGQRGRNLSLGQRQQVALARALLADPQVLILDEATASIDSFTEQAIQRALEVVMRGRTSLVIAHRLATVRHADLIVVLDQGRIVEQGSHDALVARGGVYAALVNSAPADGQA